MILTGFSQVKNFFDKRNSIILGSSKTYSDIINDAYKLAGLEYTQIEGETGQVYEGLKVGKEMMEAVVDLVENRAGLSKKRTIVEKTEKLAEYSKELARISASWEYRKKGVKTPIPGIGWLGKIFAFSNAEASNRRFAFALGFMPTFEFYYNLYREIGGVEANRAIEMAKAKGVEAGKKLTILTQFDYHAYNTPEIMRLYGPKGDILRLVLQFKKFTYNYYHMLNSVLQDSLYRLSLEDKKKFFKDKEIRKNIKKDISKVANLLATGAAISAITSWTNVGFYNFVQEDLVGFLADLVNLLHNKIEEKPIDKKFKKSINPILLKEGPLPFMAGPAVGDLLAFLLIAGSLNDANWRDYLSYHVYWRGPKNIV